MIRKGKPVAHAFYKQDNTIKNEYKIRFNALIDVCSYFFTTRTTIRGHDLLVDLVNKESFLELVKYIAEK